MPFIEDNTLPEDNQLPVSPYSNSFQDRIKDLTQKTFILILIAIVIKIFGLVRTSFTATIFGATTTLDMFFGIFGSTIVFFEVLPTAFNQALVPRYIELLVKGDRKGFNRAVSTSINYVLVLAIIVFIVCAYYAAPIRKLFFQFPLDTPSNVTTYANWLFRLAFAVLFMNVFIGSFTAILYSHDQVISPSILNFINGINVLIAMLLLHDRFIPGTTTQFGIFSMVLGYLTGGLCQIVYLAIIALRTGFKWHPLVFEGGKGFLEYVKPIGPAYLALVMGQLNIVIDRGFTSRLEDAAGQISLLQYAGQMILIILIFSTAFSNAILPKLSSTKSMNRPDEYKILLVRGIMVILLLVLPIAISAFLTARPLTALILFHGEFASNPRNVLITVNIFRIMIVWSILFLINTQFLNVFYTYKDFRLPFIISSVGVLVNIYFNMLLSGITFGLPVKALAHWGVIGITASTALGICISLILSVTLLRGKIGSILDMDLFKQIAKLGIPSVFALGIGYLFNWQVFFVRYHGVSAGTWFSLLQVLAVGFVTFTVFWYVSYLVNRDRMVFLYKILRGLITFRRRTS